MKKSFQKRTAQPKINANLPVQPLTDLESSHLSGGNGTGDDFGSWTGKRSAGTDGQLNAI